MAEWSYLSGARPLDDLREMIGDTREDDPLLPDQTLVDLIASYPSLELAASRACAKIAADQARLVNHASAGGVMDADGTRMDKYLRLSLFWRSQSVLGKRTIRPYAGGLSYEEKVDLASDLDVPPPAFRVGMHQHWGTNALPDPWDGRT